MKQLKKSLYAKKGGVTYVHVSAYYIANNVGQKISHGKLVTKKIPYYDNISIQSVADLEERGGGAPPPPPPKKYF
jgi:hypothetical protein